MMRNPGRCLVVIAALTTCPLAAFGDEIVQFRNGAEMAVRNHTVESDKAMIRLDLGENNFISFPMSMVDKIVNSGQDVFLNPTFHASNQAIAGMPSAPMVTDTTVHGNAGPVGYVRQPGKGSAGMMLGESADAIPASTKGSSPLDNQVATSRRRFNPLNQPTMGSAPQVVLPPQMARAATQLVVLPPASSEAPQQEPPPPAESNGEEPNSP